MFHVRSEGRVERGATKASRSSDGDRRRELKQRESKAEQNKEGGSQRKEIEESVQSVPWIPSQLISDLSTINFHLTSYIHWPTLDSTQSFLDSLTPGRGKKEDGEK